MVSTLDLTSFPTARNDATEDKWTMYALALMSNGVLANLANKMEVFADSTGMLVKVKTGRCFVDGFAGDLAAQQSLDIAAAHPTNPRIDNVVARLTTTSPATVAIKVITGTAASSPSAPALLDDATHTDIPLATVRVEALTGTIAAGKVTDTRVFVHPVPYDSTTNRVAFETDFMAGSYALGRPGTVLAMGSFGSLTTTTIQAFSSGSNCNVTIQTKGTGTNTTSAVVFTDQDGVAMGYFASPWGLNQHETTLVIMRQQGSFNTLQRVTEGDVDSGGSGYRVLRVPN